MSVSYKEMYLKLFNSITDALNQPEQQNYGSAKDILISAQQTTEDMYINKK